MLNSTRQLSPRVLSRLDSNQNTNLQRVMSYQLDDKRILNKMFSGLDSNQDLLGPEPSVLPVTPPEIMVGMGGIEPPSRLYQNRAKTTQLHPSIRVVTVQSITPGLVRP